MNSWKLGAPLALGALTTAAHGQVQQKLWDVLNLSNGQNYMSNVVNEGAGQIGTEPSVQLKFNAKYAQFGQMFSSPVNWTGYTGFSIIVENLENRDISFGIRFDRNSAYTDQVSSAFFLRPNESRRFYLDLSGFNPLDYGMVSPMPVLQGYYTPVFPWQTNKPLNTVFKWQVYSREDLPLKVKVTSMYGQSCNYSVNAMVDRFGQFSRYDWAHKVTGVQDLRDQKAEEDADLAANPGTGETFGSNSLGTTNATGKWRIVKSPTGRSYFVTPEGKYFWSLGVTSVSLDGSTITAGRQSMFTGLPATGDPRAAFYGTVVRNGTTKQTYNHFGANVSEKFGESWATDWKVNVGRRLRSWGLNTLGAGFDLEQLAHNSMPFVYSLNTKAFPTRLATANAYWCSLPDPFTANFVPWMTSKFLTDLQWVKNDSRLIGTYVDGEFIWGLRNGSLTDRYQIPIGALKAGATQPAKLAFLSRLQTKYGTIGALNAAWGTNVASWDSMKTTSLSLTESQVASAQADLSTFTVDFAKAYFYRVRMALRYISQNLLYLGARDCYAWAPDEIFTGQAYYVDAISIDHYDDASHTPWALFASLKKPVLIAEFSFNGRDGNSFPNLTLPGCERPDQTSRAAAAKDFLNQALASKNVIGAHWFRYVDFPISGKAESDQNYAFGIVDTTDRPSSEMVGMFRQFTENLYTNRGF